MNRWAEALIALAAAFIVMTLALWLTSCTPTAQANRAKVEAAEDQFCAMRAAQKAAEHK
jgi:hypothetical protein